MKESPNISVTAENPFEQKAAVRELKDLLMIDDAKVSANTKPTEPHSTKRREMGIDEEFDAYGVAYKLRGELSEKLRSMKLESMPDQIMEMAEKIAAEYVKAGGIDYRKNDVPTEIRYAQLSAILNVPQFIRHPKAADVLAQFLSKHTGYDRPSFPMSFDVFVDFTPDRGYELKPDIDEKYVEPLRALVDDERFWENTKRDQWGGLHGQDSEVRRILFSNVAEILVHLAKQSPELDRKTVDARIDLAGRNAMAECAIETQARLGCSLVQSDVGKESLEAELGKDEPNIGYGEAEKILNGYYMRVAW
ncbi:hypothetical protein L0Y59_00245 [Candidatus Uhrbacteria bacterium]|nr:hypothetical protein [Candidatus Uhrbacteria bacterium]